MAGNSEEVYTTATVYGIIFLCLLFMHCVARNISPRAFNPRNAVAALRCEIATRRFGSLDWIIGVCRISDQELFEQCGLDAVVYIRLLQMGFKISVVGCLNAIYLIPVYSKATKTNDNIAVTDNLDLISIANLNNNDPGMYGTVTATYIYFCFALYLIIQEFEWYTTKRHEFMSRVSPYNYTVFVGGIPNQLRSNKALHNFFNELFEDVHDVSIALELDGLDELIKQREELVLKLEHAVNVFTATGKRPMHSAGPFCGTEVDSIEAFRGDLGRMNGEVAKAISSLEQRYAQHEAALSSLSAPEPDPAPGPRPSPVRDCAFVTFRSLRSTAAAQQALLHPTPFRLWVVDAPPPHCVCWANVGLPHAAVQAGLLASSALTGALCLLWTVPVAVVASFSRVDSLKRALPFLQAASDANPLLDQVLAQVAPVALAVLIVVLPMILLVFTRLEGHIAEPAVQAGLFSKLALFKVLQIFFVSVVSGSIFDQLVELADSPGPVLMDIFGNKLPAQAGRRL